MLYIHQLSITFQFKYLLHRCISFFFLRLLILYWYRVLCYMYVSRNSMFCLNCNISHIKFEIFLTFKFCQSVTNSLQVDDTVIFRDVFHFGNKAKSRSMSNIFYWYWWLKLKLVFQYIKLFEGLVKVQCPGITANSYSISHQLGTVTTQWLPLWQCSHRSLVPDTVITEQWLHRTQTL